MSQKLIGAKRMVVKVGSALLADEAKGAIRTQWLSALAKDIAEFRAAGTEVLLVSSGAVAVGCSQLGLDRPQLRLEEKQAAAATGQIRLAHAYQEALAHHKIDTAQILLTLDDTEERRRYLNARNTLDTLLRLGAVPVINENDTIATNEIRYGDNDRLAARVATMISADTLVLLSTIDGLYDSDPLNNKDAKLIPEVRELTPDICAMAGDAPPGYTSGGMVTKLEAARLAMDRRYGPDALCLAQRCEHCAICHGMIRLESALPRQARRAPQSRGCGYLLAEGPVADDHENSILVAELELADGTGFGDHVGPDLIFLSIPVRLR